MGRRPRVGAAAHEPGVIALGRSSGFERLSALKLDVDAPVNIQFTSGHHGAPERRDLTHHNLLNNGLQVGVVTGIGPEDRVCLPVPLYPKSGYIICRSVSDRMAPGTRRGREAQTEWPRDMAAQRRKNGGTMTISLKVNGQPKTVPAEADTPLLYVLRNDLELNGAKFGCGLAQCGACTVLLDGRAVRSCVTEIGSIGESDITTIEGLGTVDKPHPLQQAFIDEQAAQCGYCINGMIMTAKDLLDQNPHPTAAEVREALAQNLCRCGTHGRIVRAVLRAGQAMGKT